MNDRRPYWDDDLLDTVQRVLNKTLPVDRPVLRLYAVIAAVEDWHKAKRDLRVRTHSTECWRWHQECAEALIERQQETIQRVRKVYESAVSRGTSVPTLLLKDALTGRDETGSWLRALDGDGDE